jgi:hypothetical protein
VDNIKTCEGVHLPQKALLISPLDKLLALTAISLVKELLVPIEWKAGSTPGTVWALELERYFFNLFLS